MIAAMHALAVPAVLLHLLLAPPLEPVTKQPELPLHPPVARSVFPLGGQVGHRTTVEIEGDFLDRISALRCQCDGLTATVRESNAVRARIDIDIAQDAVPGLRSVYLESPRGMSNAFVFRVTRWNSVLESEPNDTLSQAEVINAPLVIEGRIARLTDVDFYRFHAMKGERLAFNVMASRNEAPGFVAITILTGTGRELAHNNAAIGPDAYIDHIFRETGDYLVVVTPRRFADFFTVVKDDQLINWQYQLAIGRSPMLWSVFPMGGKRGTTVTAELHADFLPANAEAHFSGRGVKARVEPIVDDCACKYKMVIEIAADAELGARLLTFPDESGNLSTLGFAISDEKEILESSQKPQLVDLPVTINGRIRSSGERGTFRIKVNQDDEVTFHVDARTLGSRMTDPQLVLMRASGEIVDSADDRCRKCTAFDSTVRKKEMLDPSLAHAFISESANDADAAGEYDVVLLDNSSRGSLDQAYRLTVRKKQPQFHLGIMTRRVNAKLNGPTRIPVSIVREEGFDEEIAITVRGLPAGWTSKPLSIPVGRERGELEIERTNESAIAGSLEVLAKSQVATLPPVLREDGLGYLEPVETKVQILFVEPPSVSVRAEEPNGGFVLDRESPKGLIIPLLVERAKNFELPLTFSLEDAPDGVRIQSQTATQVVVEADPRQAKPGKYRIAVRAAGGLSGKEAIEVSPGFRLQVK